MTNRTTFTTVADGDYLYEGYYNGIKTAVTQSKSKEHLNHVRQLINRAGVYSADEKDLYGEAYVDADGQNDSVDTDATTALFDTDKYKTVITDTDSPMVIIEATSLTESDFFINDCVIVELSAGKWGVVALSGTAEVQRAKIYKTLFYGTNGSDAAAVNIVNCTALKTNVARDVDKYAFYAQIVNTTNSNNGQYTGTFASTSGNTDVSSWSYCYIASGSGIWSRWEMPSATVLNQRTSAGTSDETATDRTADELDNPATCQLDTGTPSSSANNIVRVFILSEQSISWASAGTGTKSDIDFNDDYSIPAMTATTEDIQDILDELNLVYHDIPSGTFNATISSFFAKALVEDFETGASIQHKITNATEDSGWINDGEIGSFTAFTSEPTIVITKLVPKTTSPTDGYPSIRGVSYEGN